MLLHVGYHKTGSSWLQRRFFSQRELGFRRITTRGLPIQDPHPLHFDAEAYRAHYAELVSEAATDGALPVLSEERLSGNPLSGGYDSAEIAERLLAIFPSAKVLIVVREQRSLILSTWFQYVKVGGACSLRDFLLGARDGRLPGFRFENFEFDRLVAHYRRLFGAERVHVELFERLGHEPREFAASILSFAGLAKSAAFERLPFGELVNRAARPLAVSLRRVLNPFLRRDSVNGYSPLANPAFRALGEGLVRVAEATAPEPLDAHLRRRWQAHIAERVGSRYVESNERLAKLSGYDLGSFGYASSRAASDTTRSSRPSAASSECSRRT